MRRLGWSINLTSLLSMICYAALSLCQQSTPGDLKFENIRLHDPWILADQPSHTYYLYTSSGAGINKDHRSGVVTYKSADLKTWSGPYPVFEVPDGSWASPTDGVWAPEVHPYHGRYYLFATMNNYATPLSTDSSQPRNPSQRTRIQITYNGVGPHPRGTQVFVSNSPAGPFRTIRDKPIPPSDYMTLDGTFYVEDGIPYMVYAHEWTQLVDGSMEAIQMKPDLSESVGKPFYLFKASDAPWLDDRHDTDNAPRNYVTDGPELYRTKTHKLLMLWSSYRRGLYVETLAHSVSGKLNGPWKQDDVLVGDDSGHGMLFRTFDGRLMLIVHHPFDPKLSRGRLYEVEDTGNSIRLKR
jgi:hypothetical protein